MPAPAAEAFVRLERTATALVITLQRPAARNALTLAMVRSIRQAIREATADPLIQRVILRSDLPGTFCSGGDIRAVREFVLGGHLAEAMCFFDEEFALNHAIATTTKPVVVLIDGICFGGGCGLALHASHPIVTENAVLAMPEARIGYIPDVGSSYFLSRLPPGVGKYLALLGARVGPGDAVSLSLASSFVASHRLKALVEALANEGAGIDEIIERFSTPVAPGEIAQHLSALANVYAPDDPEACEQNIRSSDDPWIASTLADFRKMSLNSQREAAELLRKAVGCSLADCLRQEFAAARRVIQHPDFAEGIRAALVDKDHNPRWAETRQQAFP